MLLSFVRGGVCFNAFAKISRSVIACNIYEHPYYYEAAVYHLSFNVLPLSSMLDAAGAGRVVFFCNPLGAH